MTVICSVPDKVLTVIQSINQTSIATISPNSKGLTLHRLLPGAIPTIDDKISQLVLIDNSLERCRGHIATIGW